MEILREGAASFAVCRVRAILTHWLVLIVVSGTVEVSVFGPFLCMRLYLVVAL